MFDIGMQELIVIFVVALLVFGPKRLPELGKTLGKTLTDVRRAMYSVKEQMDSELREVKEPISSETLDRINKEINEIAEAYPVIDSQQKEKAAKEDKKKNNKKDEKAS